MIRNLKMLGLMAVAALAMSAMFASAAQAQKGTVTAGATPDTHTDTELHGVQYGTAEENYFEAFEGSKVECEVGTYDGTIADGTATTLKLTPTFSACKGAGLPATVTHKGCNFIFAQPETITGGKYTGAAGLECPEGVPGLEVHIYAGGSHGFTVCTITVTPHPHNLPHVIYTNVPDSEKDHITADGTITGVTAHESGLCGSATDEEATFHTKVTLKAYADGTPTTYEKQHDLWISD